MTQTIDIGRYEDIPNLIRLCLKVLANCSNSSKSVMSSGLGSLGRVATALSGGCCDVSEELFVFDVKLLLLVLLLLLLKLLLLLLLLLV